MRMYLQRSKVEKAIVRAGNLASLARHLKVSEKTIRRWHTGLPMSLTSRSKLNVFLGEDEE